MAQTIQIKNGTGSSAPASLLQGELAINVSSGSLWYGSGSSNATHSNWMFGEITASNKIRNHLGNHTGTGNITASGTVSAGYFVGDGSGITNLSIDAQGALLESECTNVAALKSINQNLTTTSAVSFDTISANSIDITSITASIVTSSIIYSSGSNIFGDAANDNHTFNGSITASGNLEVDTIQIGDSPAAAQSYQLHVKDSQSVNAVLETTGNGNATLELKNNQTPDWAIRNKFSQGGLHFTANHNVLHLDDDGTTTISGSLVLSGAGVTSDISASGDLTADNIIASGATGKLQGYEGSFTHITLGEGLNRILKNTAAGSGEYTFQDGGIYANGNITASGNISASGGINGGHLRLNSKFVFDEGTSGVLGLDNAGQWDSYTYGRLGTSKPHTFRGNITASGNISASGNIFAEDAEFTGTIEAAVKSFSIPHQSIEGKKLVYGVLEGPEHSVYVRGKTQDKIIELPEEWKWLVHEDSITVQLTAIGKSQNLFVKDVSDNKIFINNDALFSSKVNAYYVVHATRKDVKKLKTVK
jgi:hypothetical protein